MTPEERALYDARAALDEHHFTVEILRPWVATAEAIGHPPLTQIMERALEEAEGEAKRARAELQRVEATP